LGHAKERSIDILMALITVLFLAYANGANDNFKGVATLYGSGAAGYKTAIYWATLATFLGSLTALILAQSLLTTFSGKGLVPDSILALRSFSLSVVLAAALTVMLATKYGFPVSTTHALTGALVGVGWMASPEGVNFGRLGAAFFAPLLISPVVALALTAILYPSFRYVRTRLQLRENTVFAAGNIAVGILPLSTAQVTAANLLDKMHFLSAGIVCFARAVNDTPKIAAVLLVAAVDPFLAIALVAGLMAVGGLINSRQVADTMAHKVTTMNSGQGFSANLVSSLLVIFASKFGLPVSTTHVSCGSIFGIGMVTGKAQWQTIVGILLAWVTTLPLSALLGGVIFLILR
jgi:inorganic phosphate transporter, PiT family